MRGEEISRKMKEKGEEVKLWDLIVKDIPRI